MIRFSTNWRVVLSCQATKPFNLYRAAFSDIEIELLIFFSIVME